MSKWGDNEKIVSACDRRRSYLWNEFNRLKPHLTDIARYFYPQAVHSLERDIRQVQDANTYEDEDDKNRMTSVPMDAFRICVNGFYVHLTGPNAKWFKLNSPKFGKTNPAQDDFYANEYDQLTNATWWLMGWCGAYKAFHVVYRHLTAFGFAAVLVLPDDERYVRLQTLKIGTYALGIDRKGRVNRLVRKFAFNAEQLIHEFGEENVGESVLETAKRGDTKKMYEVWNLIEPHEKMRGEKTPYTLSYTKFKYRSVYWSNEVNSDTHGLLAVRGYEIKPMVCPRINHEEGDIYGRGLAADVLGHARALQTMREDCLDIDDQNAHPSMCAPASMADDGLKLDPLSINYYPDGSQPNAIHRTIQSDLSTEGVRLDAEITEKEIRKALLNSEFETINAMEDSRPGTDRMTATEVTTRVNEKMEQLSGIATTLNDEWLDPIVTTMANYVRLYSMRGVRRALPAIIALGEPLLGSSAPFDIKYESKIHAAANAQTINAGFESLSRAASFAEGKPDVIDNFDFDEIARETHRMLGAPEAWLKNTEVRDNERAERAKAMSQQQQMQNAAIQAKAIKDVASAPIDPSTLGGKLASAGLEA